MRLTFRVVEKIRKDPELKIRALDFKDGFFYATAQKKKRRLIVKLKGPRIVAERSVDEDVAGICAVDGLVYVAARDRGVCLVLRGSDLSQIRELRCHGEGVLGLALSPEGIVMASGHQSLFWYDPRELEFKAALTLLSDGKEEFGDLTVVGQKLYAVDASSGRILEIDPKEAEIEGFIDLSSIRPQGREKASAIANDGSFLYVTGRDWPEILKISLRR